MCFVDCDDSEPQQIRKQIRCMCFVSLKSENTLKAVVFHNTLLFDFLDFLCGSS